MLFQMMIFWKKFALIVDILTMILWLFLPISSLILRLKSRISIANIFTTMKRFDSVWKVLLSNSFQSWGFFKFFSRVGSGYFDFRDENDKWLRVNLEAGDMIILPEGIYHRFTLDAKRYGKFMVSLHLLWVEFFPLNPTVYVYVAIICWRTGLDTL